MDRHPTRYEWRDNVEELLRRLYKTFGSAIHVNTYHVHPGDKNGRWTRDTAAFDVWGEDGRGIHLPPVLGDRVYNFLYTDPNEPEIDWIIYKREIWTRLTWRKRPWGVR